MSVWCQGVGWGGWGGRGLSPGASVHSSFWSLVPSRSMPGSGEPGCSPSPRGRAHPVQGTPHSGPTPLRAHGSFSSGVTFLGSFWGKELRTSVL